MLQLRATISESESTTENTDEVKSIYEEISMNKKNNNNNEDNDNHSDMKKVIKIM
jgi:hypothetical protein